MPSAFPHIHYCFPFDTTECLEHQDTKTDAEMSLISSPSRLHNHWSMWWWGQRSNRSFKKPVNKWNPGHSAEVQLLNCIRNEKCLPPCLSLSAALSLSKLSRSSWPGQKRVRSPEAFPAMIAVVLAEVDKGPIRVLNGHPLRGHPH